MRRHLLSILLLLGFGLAGSATADTLPRNVILFIGDGMGPAHVTWLHHLRGAGSHLATMRLAALVDTAAADRAVTDSAAAASAYATGMKTHYRALSVAPDGTPRRTVLEAAEAVGMATGLVTTAAFFDATPAAFAAHWPIRYERAKVIPQMLGSGVDVIAGGGLDAFGRDGLPALETLAADAGFALITSKEALATVRAARSLVVFARQERDVDHPDFPLAALTRFALERLGDDPDGFFLLVEHEGIDSASHQNHRDDTARSLRSFDDAIGVALEFARARADTLVLVTGDHETGGLRLTGNETLRPEWSTVDHTGAGVPLFVHGPGVGSLPAVVANDAVGRLLLELVGERTSRSGAHDGS